MKFLLIHILLANQHALISEILIMLHYMLLYQYYYIISSNIALLYHKVVDSSIVNSENRVIRAVKEAD